MLANYNFVSTTLFFHENFMLNQNGNFQKKSIDDGKVSNTDYTIVELKPDVNELEESNSKPVSSWMHADISIKSEYNHPPITCYNASHRNPRYAGGEFCVYTELLELQKHFHPSVALFATKILNGEFVQMISYT